MNIQTQQINTLCIPRILTDIKKEFIYDIINKLNLGKITNIDIVRSKKMSNKAFIHFSKWNNGGNADIVKERLLIGKDVKIVYNEPWFWKIVTFRKTKK